MNAASDDLVRDLEVCRCGHMRADHADAAPHACQVCDQVEECTGFVARRADE